MIVSVLTAALLSIFRLDLVFLDCCLALNNVIPKSFIPKFFQYPFGEGSRLVRLQRTTSVSGTFENVSI